jgi:hypothetical protein
MIDDCKAMVFHDLSTASASLSVQWCKTTTTKVQSTSSSTSARQGKSSTPRVLSSLVSSLLYDWDSFFGLSCAISPCSDALFVHPHRQSVTQCLHTIQKETAELRDTIHLLQRNHYLLVRGGGGGDGGGDGGGGGQPLSVHFVPPITNKPITIKLRCVNNTDIWMPLFPLCHYPVVHYGQFAQPETFAKKLQREQDRVLRRTRQEQSIGASGLVAVKYDKEDNSAVDDSYSEASLYSQINELDERVDEAARTLRKVLLRRVVFNRESLQSLLRAHASKENRQRLVRQMCKQAAERKFQEQQLLLNNQQKQQQQQADTLCGCFPWNSHHRYAQIHDHAVTSAAAVAADSTSSSILHWDGAADKQQMITSLRRLLLQFEQHRVDVRRAQKKSFHDAVWVTKDGRQVNEDATNGLIYTDAFQSFLQKYLSNKDENTDSMLLQSSTANYNHNSSKSNRSNSTTRGGRTSWLRSTFLKSLQPNSLEEPSVFGSHADETTSSLSKRLEHKLRVVADDDYAIDNGGGRVDTALYRRHSWVTGEPVTIAGRGDSLEADRAVRGARFARTASRVYQQVSSAQGECASSGAFLTATTVTPAATMMVGDQGVEEVVPELFVAGGRQRVFVLLRVVEDVLVASRGTMILEDLLQCRSFSTTTTTTNTDRLQQLKLQAQVQVQGPQVLRSPPQISPQHWLSLVRTGFQALPICHVTQSQFATMTVSSDSGSGFAPSSSPSPSPFPSPSVPLNTDSCFSDEGYRLRFGGNQKDHHNHSSLSLPSAPLLWTLLPSHILRRRYDIDDCFQSNSQNHEKHILAWTRWQAIVRGVLTRLRLQRQRRQQQHNRL